ncbi:MAG: GerMN domain-containing protein [Chitinophagales bacterium]
MKLERWLIVGLLVIGLLAGAAGFAAWRQARSLRSEVRRLGGQVSELRERQAALDQEFNRLGNEVTLWFMKETPTDLQLATERRRVFGADLPLLALQELVRGPSPGSGLRAILPRDTTVHSVKIRGGIAYADLGGGITRLNTGSEGEALLVEAVVNTLTQFPGVSRVQFLVDGAQVESLAGHVDVSAPLSRSQAMVSR